MPPNDAPNQSGFADAGPAPVVEATVAELQQLMTGGGLTASQLVDIYAVRIERLDRDGPRLNAILEVNPEAGEIAAALDDERGRTGGRGPLHGIPVLLKDNIDTADRMQTAAGSLALVGSPAGRDATVAARLRAAGAVILGKTNLSEWANFRSSSGSSGWSARGGQCRNPYAIDRNPCGSSSGSGVAASANLTSVSIGTETDGSIVCPASANGVVGIKPTVGLVSTAGVIPISPNQDTVGVHARTVADAAAVLSVLAGADPRDPATAAGAAAGVPDYSRHLNPDGLRHARIGVAREFAASSRHAAAVFEDAVAAMRQAGADLVEVTFPHLEEIVAGESEMMVLRFDFKAALNRYLATRTGVPIRTLADVIAFNTAHAGEELRFFRQDILEAAEAVDPTDPATLTTYRAALARNRVIGGAEGIDLLLGEHNLTAIVAPTANPPWPTDLINGDHEIFGSSSPAALAGYPIVSVPAGFSFGLPVGISFMGPAFSEPELIALASGFEHVTAARRRPRFLLTAAVEGQGVPGSDGG